MIRPQQKRQKQWQEMLSGIKPGDRITTSGGIRGIILSIKDDAIIIKVAPDGIKMEVAKKRHCLGNHARFAGIVAGFF